MYDSPRPNTFYLTNGLQVIAVARPWSKLAAAVLMCRAGTFDDPKGMPGTAHFVEHLAFAGDNKGIVATAASRGAEINGVTSYDYTCFASAVHVEDLGPSLEFFANILKNRPITSADIESERRVFHQELREEPGAEVERSLKLDRFWRRLLGDPNWKTYQTKSFVKTKRFTPERLNTFKEQFYRAANARLAIVSPLGSDELRHRLDNLIVKDSTFQVPSNSSPVVHRPK